MYEAEEESGDWVFTQAEIGVKEQQLEAGFR